MVKNIKALNKLGIRIFWCGWILWALETIVFLIIDGFHQKPTHPVEEFLDTMTAAMMVMGVTLIFIAIYRTHKIVLEMMNEAEKEIQEEEKL